MIAIEKKTWTVELNDEEVRAVKQLLGNMSESDVLRFTTVSASETLKKLYDALQVIE